MYCQSNIFPKKKFSTTVKHLCTAEYWGNLKKPFKLLQKLVWEKVGIRKEVLWFLLLSIAALHAAAAVCRASILKLRSRWMIPNNCFENTCIEKIFNNFFYYVVVVSYWRILRMKENNKAMHYYYSKAIRQVLIRVHWIIWLSFYVECLQAYIRIIAITTAGPQW